MNIQTIESKEGAADVMASEITSVLLQEKESAVPVLFLVSGGSALNVLDKIDFSVLGLDLTIGMLDERYSEDPEINNFDQLIQTDFGKSAEEAGCAFIDTRIQENESQEHMGSRFESALAGWRVEHPGGKIITTQGIGSDGHTSGIMPFPENELMAAELFNTPSKHVVAYDVGDKSQHNLRITTTFTFLTEEVDQSFVFMCGEDKKEALQNVTVSEASLYAVPGKIVYDMKDVVLFTDIEL